MPRSRNIKPGFFVNDELAEIEPLGRLLFIGLWTIADREGRIKDRPKKIKAQVLPFDDCNVDALLEELERQGFIVRYTVDNCNYIQVVNFTKHQNPHMKEQASEIPAPDLHDTSTMQEPDKHDKSPADSLNLIPDSLNPCTDTLKKHSESVYKILNYWNDKPFITHKDNAEIRSKIEKGLNKYSEADILTAINNYEKVYNSDFYYKHKWALTDFLKQSNGVPNFLEEGKVWENYKEHNSNSIIDGRKPV